MRSPVSTISCWPLRTAALVGGLLFPAYQALAVLGADVETVRIDQMRFKGEHRQHPGAQMTTHEISLPDGSIIKEYVNTAGVVFAVSWRTRLKPNLEALLGTPYVVPATRVGALTGVADARRQQSMRQPNLVVRQGGRMNAFAGLAYVPKLVPEGFDAETLR
jgi:hypothetical protein